MLKNTRDSYGLVNRIIHWLMSVIIIIMVIVGFTMSNMAPSDQKWQMYSAHKATGIIVLFLIIIRILWVLINTKVQIPVDLPKWQRIAARWNHNILYILMMIMPTSGALMSLLGGHDIDFFGIFIIKSIGEFKDISKVFWQIHVSSSLLLVGAIILHIAAALYHHFIRKDNVLMRMIRGY